MQQQIIKYHKAALSYGLTIKKIKQMVVSLIIFLLTTQNLKAQDLVTKDSVVTLPAGPQYKASKWKQLWWGKHYREEWLAPVQFPVIDLDATAGGLTPTKRGGGHETKSLRLLGANGREYVLRTIDKSLDALVPEDFRGTFINDLVNDQISTAHPYGPIAIANLSASAGIYHTNPVIVFVPVNNRLKEFEKDFANKLCLFEERTSGEGWENTALTGYANDVVNTEKLVEKLKADNDRQIDQKAFLKVRIFDMWVNDWDRHEDQWVWLAHKKDGKTIYTAFARDRDQSFSKTDGINLFLLSRPWALQSLQNLDSKVKNVVGTTLAARYMDKQFLTELNKQDWIAVIQSLQAALTDKVIDKAVYDLPDSVVKISGKYLADKLKSRRNDMMRYGMKYYEVLNKEVDVVGSDKTEYFTINKKSSEETELIVQKISKENKIKDTLFYRVFKTNETKRIYLYGLDGDDVFTITGTTRNKIKVTIIGGEGKDSFVAATATNKKNSVKVYDDKSNTYNVNKNYKTHFTNDTLLTQYNRKRFQYNWYTPLILPGYNPDDGVFIGTGIIYKKKGWGKSPYVWQQQLRVSAAFKTGATSFSYDGRFKKLLGQWDFELAASYKGPQYVFNFYGFGNDTKLLTDDRAYNRVTVRQLIVDPKIARTFGNQEIKWGVFLEQVKVVTKEGKFITDNTAGINENVFQTNTFLGTQLQYNNGKVNSERYPKRGYNFQSTATYKRNITAEKKDFLNLQGAIAFYVPLGKLVLAHRTGAATNFGDYEFYHANTLGGIKNLRGYYKTRFTGNTTFYQNTELRCALAKLKGYVFRGTLGAYGFFDDGRVWIKNDNSNKLHTSYGAGVFFLPFNAAAFNLSFESSREINIIKFGADFFF